MSKDAERDIALKILRATRIKGRKDKTIYRSLKRTTMEDTLHATNPSVHSEWSYLERGWRRTRRKIGNPRVQHVVTHLGYDIMTTEMSSGDILDRAIDYCSYDGSNICENSVRMLSDIIEASNNTCDEFELWYRLQ